MRSRKDILAFVASVFMTLLLLMACAPTSAHAETRYTVRVFGGNRGSVNGTEEYYVLPDTFAYEDAVNLNDYIDASDGYKGIAITDDKYYVKGYRKSGEDWLTTSSFQIKEDTDFVVAYGVRGDQVSYTISFIEYGTGRALQNDEGQTSVTFYGNKGDKPVVPYEYVPGYRPRYRNITGTLGDEGTNNWTLEYIAVEVPVVSEVVTETTTTGTTTGTTGTGTTGTGTTGTGTTGTTEATPGTTATGEGTTTEGQAQPTTTTETTPEVVAAPPTEEIIDVDTPLAGPDGQTQGEGEQKPDGSDKKEQKKNAFSSVAVKLIIAIVALALALAAFFALRRPKTNDDDGKGSLG
jgi:hypothetical protein